MKKGFNKKRIIPVVLFLFFVSIVSFVFVSCGKSYNKDESVCEDKAEYDYDFNYEESKSADGITYAGEEISGSDEERVERKQIVKKRYVVETLEFDKDKETIRNKMEECGGYIERSEINGNSLFDEHSRRYAEIVLRIPKEKFNDFIESVENDMYVVNQYEDTTDVTLQYYDTETRVRTLKVQEERLIKLLEKSGEMKDIIEVEKALEEVRYSIESNTTTLKKLNNLVNYATVTIELREVRRVTPVKVEPETLSSRIKTGFNSSVYEVKELLKRATVEVIAFIPYLLMYIPLIIIILISIRIIRKRIKKINKKKIDVKENSESKDE